MILQLFYDKPHNDIIMKLITSIGYTNLYQKQIIYVSEMEKNSVLQKFNNIINDIKPNYIPCKQKYCTNLTLKKCINITRQHLKTINYDMISNVYYINNKRERGYRIIPLSQKKFIKNKMEIEIKFD